MLSNISIYTILKTRSAFPVSISALSQQYAIVQQRQYIAAWSVGFSSVLALRIQELYTHRLKWMKLYSAQTFFFFKKGDVKFTLLSLQNLIDLSNRWCCV